MMDRGLRDIYEIRLRWAEGERLKSGGHWDSEPAVARLENERDRLRAENERLQIQYDIQRTRASRAGADLAAAREREERLLEECDGLYRALWPFGIVAADLPSLPRDRQWRLVLEEAVKPKEWKRAAELTEEWQRRAREAAEQGTGSAFRHPWPSEQIVGDGADTEAPAPEPERPDVKVTGLPTVTRPPLVIEDDDDLAPDRPFAPGNVGGPKRPEYEPSSPQQALAYFVEELGEALAAAGKSQRWGLDSVNPELPPEEQETNAAWLRREILDVEAAIERVRWGIPDLRRIEDDDE